MSAVLTNKLTRLIDRAHMLAQVRTFFAQKGVLEVDTPILTPGAPLDPYIDLVTARCMGQSGYLHSSPEYGMKRLLALGIGDCYQLGHVFRDHELGEKHAPEFTMIEWYRVGGRFEHLIEETLELAQLFIGHHAVKRYGYEEIFWEYLDTYPDTLEERDYRFALEIEPYLEDLTVVSAYPPEQAMLAKTVVQGDCLVAQRFELFYKGTELANGYHELGNLTELRRRLEANQQLRGKLGKEVYPLDEPFLAAQIPDCCGVAVGFDRLMMLRHHVPHIREVVPFVWNE